jgi:hypothetical protein
MRCTAIVILLALSSCGYAGYPDFEAKSEAFHLDSTQHTPIQIAECLTTALDRTHLPVSRQTTADEGKTIVLQGGHPGSQPIIQWMAWIKGDSSVDTRSSWRTDELLQTFETCTGKRPLPI